MIVSEISVSYKPATSPNDRPIIKSSRDLYEHLDQIWNMDIIEFREEFVVLYMDRKNGIIGHFLHSIGSDVGTVVSVKHIIAIALKVNACNLILMHNHPSGQLRPSAPDKQITKKLKRAANLFDIKLLDHMIVTSEGYFSFADEGIL
jgi:DNA repair protein RadC